MTRPVHIVHIAPHLGGGVGKTLLTLAQAQRDSGFAHAFLLLERPEKTQFVEQLRALGCRVELAADDPAAAHALLAAADIVQLEWWNHPATFAFLCGRALPAMRLVAWCHVSGLHMPLIPRGLFEAAARLLFTSACSLQSDTVATLTGEARRRVDVVPSGVGLTAPRKRTRGSSAGVRVGYVGSLNFSKLHPRFVDFLAAVDVPGFRVEVWGDVQNREQLLEQCRRAGKPDLIAFEGYTTDVAEVFASLDVIAYLLNPRHYGTGENVLLEAMSAGVVPVVLGNPAESVLVEDGRTGVVVDSPRSFAAAIARLAADPEARMALGRNAAGEIAARFTPAALGEAMSAQYRALLAEQKRTVDFHRHLGAEPGDWFLACQARPAQFAADLPDLARDPVARNDLFEPSKGSLAHFCSYFPDDARLGTWLAHARECMPA